MVCGLTLPKCKTLNFVRLCCYVVEIYSFLSNALPRCHNSLGLDLKVILLEPQQKPMLVYMVALIVTKSGTCL